MRAHPDKNFNLNLSWLLLPKANPSTYFKLHEHICISVAYVCTHLFHACEWKKERKATEVMLCEETGSCRQIASFPEYQHQILIWPHMGWASRAWDCVLHLKQDAVFFQSGLYWDAVSCLCCQRRIWYVWMHRLIIQLLLFVLMCC